MEPHIFRKFSSNLKRVLIAAERIAREQNSVMNTEHQLLALTMIKDSLANEILTNFEITADRTQLVVALVSSEMTENAPDGIAADAKAAIQGSVSVASRFNHYVIDTEHLLLSLLSNKKYHSYAIIERLGIKPEEIVKQVETIFGNISDTINTMKQGDEAESPEQGMPIGQEDVPAFDIFNPMGAMPGQENGGGSKSKESFLAQYTTNMNKQAQSGKLDPVIGREKETERLIQILCRRTKNNPILLGEPGIGKTSIVEGLAQRIVDGHVPVKLANKEILSIDMGSLLAGTMYRGQFESRVKKLLAEIKKNGNIILFIDEIHTVVGAGSTEGSIDAANLLKPMLARGELRLIGSTTLDEYKKYIERDAAFERRFQPILVKEPTALEALEILKGVKERYEQFHHVRFTNEALENAVSLSKRYINDRFLPDKAIDLMDEAAAATNTISPVTTELSHLRRELRKVLRRKEDLIVREDYEAATELRRREIEIENKIKKLKVEDKSQKPNIITVNDIANVVARWTGIPVTELTVTDKRKILDLEKVLKKSIIGQDEAITEIARVIKRSRVGITNPNRPSGSFIFLGPTGVGKTELAKVLAHELLGDRNALIKIDMSEFMEKHNVSRLVGAPAGYIGYEEGGKLTEAVRRNPYSLILLDEIEKAHPEVFNILLQILEDGELTDARGRRVDFKNTILIMTSNLGTNFFQKQVAIGFNHDTDEKAQYELLKKDIDQALKDFFKPEFLNRVDKTIIFHPLNKEMITEIVKLQLHELAERAKNQKIKIVLAAPVLNWIADKGFSPDFGARPIRKVISDHIEVPLSEAILNEDFVTGDRVEISINNDQIILKKAEQRRRTKSNA